MNYVNPDNHVTEAESNTIVKKKRFKIAYY